MRKIFYYLLITIGLLVSTSFAQSEESSDENSVSISAECSFFSKYIWHGITYTDGLAIQPMITQELGAWSIQLWGNFVGKDKNEVTDSEIDLYVNYSFELGKLSLTPSLFYYTYPDNKESKPTAELSLELSYPIGAFAIGTTFCTDIKEATGYVFGTHDISFEKEFFGNTVLNLTAGVGWGTSKFFEYYLGVSKNSLSYYHAGADVTYSLNESLSVKGVAEFYMNADSEFEELVGKNATNFGVTILYSF